MDIEGSDQMTARSSLKNAGFTNIPSATTAAPGAAEPVTMGAGQVLKVDPGMGSTVPCDGKVTLTLASGESQVPDLYGMSEDVATSTAGAAGFQVTSQPQDYDANTCNSNPNTVCRTTPNAGTYAFRGTTIVIFLAGSPPPPPPAPTTPTVTITVPPIVPSSDPTPGG